MFANVLKLLTRKKKRAGITKFNRSYLAKQERLEEKNDQYNKECSSDKVDDKKKGMHDPSTTFIGTSTKSWI